MHSKIARLIAGHVIDVDRVAGPIDCLESLEVGVLEVGVFGQIAPEVSISAKIVGTTLLFSRRTFLPIKSAAIHT